MAERRSLVDELSVLLEDDVVVEDEVSVEVVKPSALANTSSDTVPSWLVCRDEKICAASSEADPDAWPLW